MVGWLVHVRLRTYPSAGHACTHSHQTDLKERVEAVNKVCHVHAQGPEARVGLVHARAPLLLVHLQRK